MTGSWEPPKSPVEQVLAPDRDKLMIEYLQNEVFRLRALVDRLARFRRPVFAVEGSPPSDMPFTGAVDYRVELQVPHWRLITLRSKLDVAYWDQPFWGQVFDELASRAHRTLVEGVERYREEHL